MSLLAMVAYMLAAPGPGDEPQLVRPWQSPVDAFAAAAADAATLPVDQALFARYVHLPIADDRLLRWHVFTVNECVSAVDNPNIVLPTVLAGGHLARWDLRLLAPRIIDGKPDVFRLMAAWDSIFDQTMYVALVEPLTLRIAVPPYKAKDGVIYNFAWRERSTVPDVMFEPHATQLMGATLTNTPLVSLYEFQRLAMTTVDDGMYYDFLGLADTVEGLLGQLGADRDKIEELRADIKAVQLVSGVTNAPRRIIALPGIHSRVSVNQGVLWITEDFAHGQLDVATDPLRNLQGNKHDASEIIIERSNGGHIYYLADGDGRRQDNAPDFLVRDSTITRPGDHRLQPARSCIVCHSLKGERGLREFTSDIRGILEQLEYAGERDSNQDQIDGLNRLAGQIEWDPTKVVTRGRDDYSDFHVQATGHLQPEDIGEMTRSFFNDYWESPVSPEQICIELGLAIEQADSAGEVLRKAIPPRNVLITPDLIAEDVYIAALMSGKSIARPNALQVVLEMRRRLHTEQDND